MISPVMPVYSRSDLKFVKGEGAYLFEESGDKYLDFAAGIAVNILGHSHPALIDALTNQAKKIWHCSNLYQIDGLEELSKKLVENSFADSVFFCNSGTEAVESGIKMIRKYSNPEKNRIIVFDGAFHGRSITTISAGSAKKNKEGFEPLVDGFDVAKFNDIGSLRDALRQDTAGVLIEPIQGEGGVAVADQRFMKALRKFCDEEKLLLMFDEVQCGMGRSGKLFAYENYDIKPDIMALAKGLGGGFPVGACLATEKVANAMSAGTHGGTYGGNPLAVAVCRAILDEILDNKILENVRDQSEYLANGIAALNQGRDSIISEVRGKGLMIGIKFRVFNREVVERLREKKILTVPAADNIVRILPPLNITQKEAIEFLDRFKEVIEDIKNEQQTNPTFYKF